MMIKDKTKGITFITARYDYARKEGEGSGYDRGDGQGCCWGDRRGKGDGVGWGGSGGKGRYWLTAWWNGRL